LGTGFIISGSGLIITAHNNVEGATRLTVSIHGTAYPATALGVDPSENVALLRVQGISNLPPVTFGNSSTVTTGEAVALFGNVGGSGPISVTTGTVVAVDQAISTSPDPLSGATLNLTGMIETTAPLDPGSAGGPLIDASGAVIGVMVVGDVSTATYAALPINRVRSIADAIVSGRGGNGIIVPTGAFLGVLVGDQSGAGGTGVIISSVVPGSPAAEAGITPNAVILAIAGSPTTTPGALTTIINRHHPGDHLTITIREPSGPVTTKQVTLASGGPVP
jgi:S1-C subfamily serine protease